MLEKNKLGLVDGGITFDDRGSITYCNELDLSNFKRYYIVSNFNKSFIRAWHGHKEETKIAMPIEGTVMFCVVKVNNWKNPNKKSDIKKFVISSNQPKMLIIPSGHTHGFMTLTDNAKVIFYSDKTLEESIDDDFRLPFDYWNPWLINQR